jgi:hypothetical protein
LLSKLVKAKGLVLDGSERDNPMPKVNANCELTWGDFYLFLSRSTTPHLIQGSRKVQDFIQQQIKSGSEALSSFFENQNGAKTSSNADNLHIPESSEEDR